MKQYKLVIIEDEAKITQMIKEYLEKEGFLVAQAKDGATGLALVKTMSPHLVILDLMLPDMGGLEVCRKIRRDGNTPIIMLTAKSQETDRVVGLEMGADDYIIKPFSLAELAARIRAVLRRSVNREESQREEKKIARGELTIDLEHYQVKKGKNEIELTPTEFKILALMARHPGKIFSRLQLLESCLGDAYSGYERSMDTHISNLRKKIKDNTESPMIVTVFGVGYKFNG